MIYFKAYYDLFQEVEYASLNKICNKFLFLSALITN